VAAGVAGAPLAQSAGGSVERVQRESTNQQRQADAARHADSAAGIAETDGQEHQTNERDADGRRPWELPPRAAPPPPEPEPDPPAASRDASGTCGQHLDLSG
jgi:hypothetical protein